MNPIIVYYHVSTVEGTALMAITEKSYWDKYGVMDDGGGDHYEDIAIAMSDCGQVEYCTSVYELASVSETQSIIENMRTLGFELQEKEEFSVFLEGNQSEEESW